MVLDRQGGNWGSVTTDSAGNCLVLWCGPGLYWAYRRATGSWTPVLTFVGDIDAIDFSTLTMDSARFAFSAAAGATGYDWEQLNLYTWGFPPNDASPRPKAADAPKAVI